MQPNHQILLEHCKGFWCDHSLPDGDPPASESLDKSSAEVRALYVMTASQVVARTSRHSTNSPLLLGLNMLTLGLGLYPYSSRGLRGNPQ